MTDYLSDVFRPFRNAVGPAYSGPSFAPNLSTSPNARKPKPGSVNPMAGWRSASQFASAIPSSPSGKGSGTDGVTDYLSIPDWEQANQAGLAAINNGPDAQAIASISSAPFAPGATADQISQNMLTRQAAITKRSQSLAALSTAFQNKMGAAYTASFGGSGPKSNMQNGKYVGVYGSLANAQLQGGF